MPTQINGDTGVSKIQDGVVVQADLAPNVVGNGPAFAAYQTVAQSLTSTMAKINLQTEEFDTAPCFDTSTSRFTPNVAGYYQLNGAVSVSLSATQVTTSIFKNGVEVKRGHNTVTNSGTGSVSALVYLNGTTDYVELWGSFLTTQNTSASAVLTWFNGCLVRAA